MQLTEQQVLSKLAALCSRSEHCVKEMTDKMTKWGVDERTQASVIAYLVSEKYIDEERYARFFIDDKVKGNKWGRRKVEQALYFKGVPETIYRPILEELEDSDYEHILRPMIEQKRKTVTGKTDYEIRCKLIRFGLSRGFSMEQVLSCLNE